MPVPVKFIAPGPELLPGFSIYVHLQLQYRKKGEVGNLHNQYNKPRDSVRLER